MPAHWIMNGTSIVPELTSTWYSLVREPLRVQSQAPHGRAEERVRLGDTEGEERADQRDAEAGDAVQELGERRSPAARPDEGQAEHRQQHQRADLARGRQPGQHAGQHRVDQALALPGALAEEQRRRGETRDVGVDREEVRQLDVQHGDAPAAAPPDARCARRRRAAPAARRTGSCRGRPAPTARDRRRRPCRSSVRPVHSATTRVSVSGSWP